MSKNFFVFLFGILAVVSSIFFFKRSVVNEKAKLYSATLFDESGSANKLNLILGGQIVTNTYTINQSGISNNIYIQININSGLWSEVLNQLAKNNNLENQRFYTLGQSASGPYDDLFYVYNSLKKVKLNRVILALNLSGFEFTQTTDLASTLEALYVIEEAVKEFPQLKDSAQDLIASITSSKEFSIAESLYTKNWRKTLESKLALVRYDREGQNSYWYDGIQATSDSISKAINSNKTQIDYGLNLNHQLDDEEFVQNREFEYSILKKYLITNYKNLGLNKPILAPIEYKYAYLDQGALYFNYLKFFSELLGQHGVELVVYLPPHLGVQSRMAHSRHKKFVNTVKERLNSDRFKLIDHTYLKTITSYDLILFSLSEVKIGNMFNIMGKLKTGVAFLNELFDRKDVSDNLLPNEVSNAETAIENMKFISIKDFIEIKKYDYFYKWYISLSGTELQALMSQEKDLEKHYFATYYPQTAAEKVSKLLGIQKLNYKCKKKDKCLPYNTLVSMKQFIYESDF